MEWLPWYSRKTICLRFHCARNKQQQVFWVCCNNNWFRLIAVNHKHAKTRQVTFLWQFCINSWLRVNAKKLMLKKFHTKLAEEEQQKSWRKNQQHVHKHGSQVEWTWILAKNSHNSELAVWRTKIISKCKSQRKDSRCTSGRIEFLGHKKKSRIGRDGFADGSIAVPVQPAAGEPA